MAVEMSVDHLTTGTLMGSGNYSAATNVTRAAYHSGIVKLHEVAAIFIPAAALLLRLEIPRRRVDLRRRRRRLLPLTQLRDAHVK